MSSIPANLPLRNDLIGEEGECVVRFILEDKAIAEVLKG